MCDEKFVYLQIISEILSSLQNKQIAEDLKDFYERFRGDKWERLYWSQWEQTTTRLLEA